ncbi:Similar to S.cerevisiae protein PEX13 (Peroxisomal importomer complex component) [Malassezia sympodialis ATCC 42132]|uniref:Peroxisomal membrane protein PEX13 n=1 Tax=Malassezia sympodialis (strain ATCC 42132) TaxID=1230383 RepID=A0A1M8A6L6_MALS4|nr:Similar to S.cerevisiae protein PEX13 (Peroxisomal importomer complex component) [Malassezia sympodialis ATCC 42132]
MPVPPKPWERSGGVDSVPISSPSPNATTDVAPAIPERPSNLSSANPDSVVGAHRSGPGGYGTGMGGYGSYGSTYNSPYSRFGGYGGYGSMGYGGMGYGGMGYGGFGNMGYGGYGGMGYGGYGGMGYGGFGGMGYGQPGEYSLTQRMESGTQATFELISSIVGAFGGFAQMLESTFMATHSSFFAMVGVADQFAHLRNYLGEVLSIFALARQLKHLYLRMTGRGSLVGIDPKEFSDFRRGAPGKHRPSKRPLFIFFLAVIGLPYLMGKLVRLITAKQDEERARLAKQAAEAGTDLQLLQDAQGSSVIDPSKLTFVRARFAYSAADNLELSLKQNEIVAVLSKTNPETGEESQWWRGRTRDGRIGWFPSTYVETLEQARDRANKASQRPLAIESSAQKGTEAKPAATKSIS